MGPTKISAKPFSRSHVILCIWVPLAPGIHELVRASPETSLPFILGLPLEDPQTRSQRTKERLHLTIQSIYTDNPEEGAGHGEGRRVSLSYRKGGKEPARLLSGWSHSFEAKATSWFRAETKPDNLISILGSHLVRRENQLLQVDLQPPCTHLSKH